MAPHVVFKMSPFETRVEGCPQCFRENKLWKSAASSSLSAFVSASGQKSGGSRNLGSSIPVTVLKKLMNRKTIIWLDANMSDSQKSVSGLSLLHRPFGTIEGFLQC